MVVAHLVTISCAGYGAMKYLKLVLPLGSLAGTLMLAGHMVGLA
jgi:hypothetical protein